MSRSLRTMLGRFRGSGRDARSSASADATAVGYYKLDKVTSDSKNSGDILTKSTTTEPASFASQMHSVNSSKPVGEEAFNVPARHSVYGQAC